MWNSVVTLIKDSVFSVPLVSCLSMDFVLEDAALIKFILIESVSVRVDL